MTSRHPSLTTALKRLLRCLSLILLPALTTEVVRGNPVSRSFLSRDPIDGPGATSHRGEQVPYLTAVTAIPLRFEDLPSPPNFAIEPLPMGLAMPDDSTLPTLAAPTIKEKPGIIPAPSASIAASPSNSVLSPQAKNPENRRREPHHELTPILPDDMHHDVRPEDVIPYFQFPHGGVILNTPVPPQPSQPTLPPSSATYTEQ